MQLSPFYISHLRKDARLSSKGTRHASVCYHLYTMHRMSTKVCLLSPGPWTSGLIGRALISTEEQSLAGLRATCHDLGQAGRLPGAITHILSLIIANLPDLFVNKLFSVLAQQPIIGWWQWSLHSARDVGFQIVPRLLAPSCWRPCR